MRVTDLTPDHVGRRVSILGADWQVVGRLLAVETDYDYVWEDTVEDPDPEPTPTTKNVTINVSGWIRDVSESWEINVGMLE